MLQVWLKVKFRIFGWTLGTVEESYVAAFDGKTVQWTPVPWSDVDPPVTAKTLVNTNGVTLAILADLNLGAE